MPNKNLVFMVDTATRQILAEVETLRSVDGPPRLKSDSEGFVTAINPLLVAEITDVGRSVMAMKPIFDSVPLPELKLQVSQYAVLRDETEKSLRSTYEATLLAHKARLSGIELSGTAPPAPHLAPVQDPGNPFLR